jgi:hypothetical protein
LGRRAAEADKDWEDAVWGTALMIEFPVLPDGEEDGEATLRLANSIASVEIDRKWDFEVKRLARLNEIKHNPNGT